MSVVFLEVMRCNHALGVYYYLLSHTVKHSSSLRPIWILDSLKKTGGLENKEDRKQKIDVIFKSFFFFMILIITDFGDFSEK